MPKQQNKKSGGARKYGRDKEKCKVYRDHQIREKNKVRRVLRSSGLAAAKAYAERNRVKLPKIAKQDGKDT